MPARLVRPRVRPLGPALAALSAALSAACATAPLQAQVASPAAARPALPAPDAPAGRYSVAVNPLALPFGVVTAEVEAPLGAPGLTVGVGGFGDFSGDEDRYSWLQAKLKYYPGEVALRGFAVGITAGVIHGRSVEDQWSFGGRAPSPVVRTESGPTIGVVLDYNWLLGPRRRFLVGAGVGARRVLGTIDEDGPLEQVIPDGRLTVGWAF